MDFDGSNLGGLSGKSRVSDETKGGLDSGVCEKLNIDGGVCENFNFGTLSADNLNGRKRGIEEIDDEVD